MTADSIQPASIEKERYHSLDYLRGIAALLIMVYHYCTWTYGVYSSASFLGRAGIYGVSIFYVLSGLTLYLVYNKTAVNFVLFLRDFFIKRIFRIMPLLWLAIFLTIVITHPVIDRRTLFLNVTGLFGIVDCNISIARAGWSIGNEIVFYLFFPVFLLLSKKMVSVFYLFSLAIFGIFVWFAFYKINSQSTIEKEWAVYINPLNQVFLFLAGYLIGFF